MSQLLLKQHTLTRTHDAASDVNREMCVSVYVFHDRKAEDTIGYFTFFRSKLHQLELYTRAHHEYLMDGNEVGPNSRRFSCPHLPLPDIIR